MEVIKNGDYVLYGDMVGKVELIVGEKVIANVDGLKVKDHISKFKLWDKDKIHNISKEDFVLAVDKVLDIEYLINKYPSLGAYDINVIINSGALIIQNLKDELFGGNHA